MYLSIVIEGLYLKALLARESMDFQYFKQILKIEPLRLSASGLFSKSLSEEFGSSGVILEYPRRAYIPQIPHVSL